MQQKGINRDKFKEFILDVLNYNGIIGYLQEIKQESPRLFGDFAKIIEKVANSELKENFAKYKKLDNFIGEYAR